MEKYYTIYDIIIGLRPEYLKTKEELEALKKYLEILVKNRDVDFFVQTAGVDYPRMLYYMHKTVKTSTILGVDDIFKRFIPHQAPMPLGQDYDIYFVPEADVYIKNKKQFSADVEKILNSEFVQNINFEKKFGDSDISIDSGFVRFSNGDESLVYGVNGVIQSSEIDLLCYGIPQSVLPEYHVEMIEKNKSLKKVK